MFTAAATQGCLGNLTFFNIGHALAIVLAMLLALGIGLDLALDSAFDLAAGSRMQIPCCVSRAL